MNVIHDPALLRKYMEKYRIMDFFSTKNLHFQLFRYAKGEMLASPSNFPHYLQFITAGTISIYSIQPDGRQYIIVKEPPLTILGDMEFVNHNVTPFFVEAVSTIYSVSLSLDIYTKQLETDILFLRLLLQSLAKKFNFISYEHIRSSSLEQNLFYHLKYISPDHVIEHVGETAQHLHCSRRQLQRILKKMQNENKLLKTSKGHYQLIE